MRMATNRVTTWWDGPKQFDVPAGEPVDACLPGQAPEPYRAQFTRDIAAYAKRDGRAFTVIKIRNWYAIIDRDWLQQPEIVLPKDGEKFGENISRRVKSLFK
jgi:hypothetical protein